MVDNLQNQQQHTAFYSMYNVITLAHGFQLIRDTNINVNFTIHLAYSDRYVCLTPICLPRCVL